jgi:hypothetical protein
MNQRIRIEEQEVLGDPCPHCNQTNTKIWYQVYVGEIIDIAYRNREDAERRAFYLKTTPGLGSNRIAS